VTADQNTEQIKTIFDAFGRGDIAYILGQLVDDARFTAHLDSTVPWAGTFEGKDRIGQYFQALGGSVEVSDHPVNALIAQEDTVVATGDVSFRVRDTGKVGMSSWVYIFKLANGAVTSFDQFNDTGLSEAFAK
jgi:ketosteroid isomerase-like protein